MRSLIIVGLAACTVGACAPHTGGAMTGPMDEATAMTAPGAMEFVRMAGASDLYEIQSSQAVLQTTQDPDVRRFAQMMVEHHTQTTATVMAAARAADLAPPPPALDARQQAMIQQLQQARGQDRDTLYLRQQVTAHEMALALHTNYATSGDTPQLMAAAGTARPIVARHLEEVRGLATRST